MNTTRPYTITCVLIAVLVFTSSAGLGQTATGGSAGPWQDREIGGRLQALLDSIIDVEHEDPIHNVVLLVECPGTTWKGAAGMADGLNEAMTAGHKFKIASIGKTFTATIILQLMEEGRLSLDDTIDKFFAAVPDVRLDSLDIHEGTSCGRQITVGHLLGQTSGLKCYLGDDPRFIEYILENPLTQWTPAMMLGKYFEYGLHTKAAFPPGEGFEYSDTNYLLLAMIIEHVTSSPLHVVLNERICDPLGLADTYLEFYEEPRGDAPLSHAYYGGMDLDGSVNTSFDWGGGGIVSTCDDLNTFIRALFGLRLFREKSTLEWMLASTDETSRWNYGLGIKKTPTSGLALYGHPGAYGCDMYYCPDEDMSICITVNQMNTHGRKQGLREDVVSAVFPEASQD
jgi:D-alanyl-D-alanine carboxypeptidase